MERITRMEWNSFPFKRKQEIRKKWKSRDMQNSTI